MVTYTRVENALEYLDNLILKLDILFSSATSVNYPHTHNRKLTLTLLTSVTALVSELTLKHLVIQESD